MKPTTQYKLIGGLCVPASTPDDYFAQADREYAAKSKTMGELGSRVRAQIEHDKRWPLGPEAHGDTYLVEEMKVKL